MESSAEYGTGVGLHVRFRSLTPLRSPGVTGGGDRGLDPKRDPLSFVAPGLTLPCPVHPTPTTSCNSTHPSPPRTHAGPVHLGGSPRLRVPGSTGPSTTDQSLDPNAWPGANSERPERGRWDVRPDTTVCHQRKTRPHTKKGKRTPHSHVSTRPPAAPAHTLTHTTRIPAHTTVDACAQTSRAFTHTRTHHTPYAARTSLSHRPPGCRSPDRG